MDRVILSYIQAEILLQISHSGEVIGVSPDLGLTTVEVRIEPDGLSFPGGQSLSWEDLQVILASQNSCFVVGVHEIHKAQVFSEETNRLYSLMPTALAPTMLVSGIPMHRIKGTNPYRDTLEKIKTIKPLIGEVLDTATGLGYTAIEAAKTADHVVTIELDPAATKVARLNPWSRALFDNPKISQIIGDSFEKVVEFEEGRFTCVIHDPPTIGLAGDLYSWEFYCNLYRLLRSGGRLFHYVGDPQSKSGRRITGGVIRRLREAGFRRIERAPRAFGVVAYKA